jgi:hypothetical protein
LDEPLPDSEYMIPAKWSVRRWKNEDKEFDPLNFLITLGALLTMVLLLLIAMQFALVDPGFRFGLLLLGLAIAALVLIGRSYRSRGGNPIFNREERQNLEGRNPLQATAEELDLAFEGNPFSQMLALQELKELLVDRLVLRKHVSRSEVMDMASDRIWLREEVSQPELRYLLTIDLKEAYAPELSGSTSQLEMIAAFPNTYERILELLEEI